MLLYTCQLLFSSYCIAKQPQNVNRSLSISYCSHASCHSVENIVELKKPGKLALALEKKGPALPMIKGKVTTRITADIIFKIITVMLDTTAATLLLCRLASFLSSVARTIKIKFLT